MAQQRIRNQNENEIGWFHSMVFFFCFVFFFLGLALPFWASKSMNREKAETREMKVSFFSLCLSEFPTADLTSFSLPHASS